MSNHFIAMVAGATACVSLAAVAAPYLLTGFGAEEAVEVATMPSPPVRAVVRHPASEEAGEGASEAAEHGMDRDARRR